MNNLSYPFPANEEQRLDALASYRMLDTLPEADFDELTLLASQICQTPVAIIGLIDDKRHWFKSILGADVKENLREYAFCTHTIAGTEAVVVADVRKDARFASNPLVTGSPNIVFYAGVPLINEEGYALGSLCVMDMQPKELTEQQISALKVLGKQVLAQFELRRKLANLQRANDALLETNTFIQKFATTAAHDIKNPLSSMLLTSQAIHMRLAKSGDEKSRGLAEINIASTKKLLTMVDEMLAYSSSPALLLTNQKRIDLNPLLKELIRLIDLPAGLQINLPAVNAVITCSAVALEQIFINLLTNAIRYNDKADGIISIKFLDEGNHYRFKIADNGMGIAEKNLERIFHNEVTLNVVDRFNKKGTGVGLYTVKALVDKLQGTITVTSQVGSGTTFEFTVRKNTGVADNV